MKKHVVKLAFTCTLIMMGAIASPAVFNSSPVAAAKSQVVAEIGAEQAQRIALQQAGGGTVIKCKLDREHGRVVYEVKVVNGNTKYSFDIGATDSIVYYYKEKLIAVHAPASTDGEITLEQARSIALAKTGGGVITKIRMDEEYGIQVYEVDVRDGAVRYELEIGVADGTVIEFKKEIK